MIGAQGIIEWRIEINSIQCTAIVENVYCIINITDSYSRFSVKWIDKVRPPLAFQLQYKNVSVTQLQ